MARKKATQPDEATMQEFMEATSYTETPVQEQSASTEQSNNVSMNDIARAAFLEYRKAGVITDKEVDDYTIREFKADNHKLHRVMANALLGDKFSEQDNNTLMMTAMVAAYLNEVDLNKYYTIKTR